MDVLIRPDGHAFVIYNELVRLSALGPSSIARASHVEPDSAGQWWADLAPVLGPRLGPFLLRSQALAAEAVWLEEHLPVLDVPVPSI